jgi:carboxypeptidase Q
MLPTQRSQPRIIGSRIAAARLGALALLPALLAIHTAGAEAQTFPTDDPVIRAIWLEGTDHSQLETLAQTLLDSIGPRLAGTPGMEAANDWALATLTGWGIDARNEQYGSWRGWERGVSHLDLIAPRVRSLEAMLLAWSPGTDGVVESEVITLPPPQGAEAFRAWAEGAGGKFVLLSRPEASCRPLDSYEEFGRDGARDRAEARRDTARDAWTERMESYGLERQEMVDALESAGAAGFLTSLWTGGWGTNRIFSMAHAFGAMNRKVPAFDVGCEDYGLLYRLAENGQGPRVRAMAEAKDLGDQPVFNTIGMIPGSELPDEYVVLSAHFDSWDGGSGATDNGTGSLTMLEAIRILKTVYPNPRRTILIGLWGSEEQGLNGSRAFATDHPEVVEGMQALFNQDNGTGRISTISMQGLTGAGAHWGRWLSAVPPELDGDLDFRIPGNPSGGGTDHASFICAGAPAFGVFSIRFDYFQYTWHTSRDTYDKLVWEDLRDNAVLVAMLAYRASEDPEFVPRDRRVMPMDPDTGERRAWPECEDGARETSERFR